MLRWDGGTGQRWAEVVRSPGRRPCPRHHLPAPGHHAVLDQLHLDSTQPEITSTADAILRESGSPYTLPGLISGLDEVISQLFRARSEPFRVVHLVWIGDDAVQLRNELIAAVKKAGSSSHGKCAAPGWTVTVAFGTAARLLPRSRASDWRQARPRTPARARPAGRVPCGWRPR